MSEWRGLHNPERHKGNQPDTRCVRCHGGYEVCEPDAPCYCCLAAEVEALRARVQAVRDVCKTYHLDDSYPNRRKVVFLDRILRALDRNVIGGGDNEAT